MELNRSRGLKGALFILASLPAGGSPGTAHELETRARRGNTSADFPNVATVTLTQ